MNRRVAHTGALVVTVTVALFALCMLLSFSFGSYLVCMLLPLGFIMVAAGFACECREDRRAAAYTGLAFAGVYATLVLLVYCAQTTTVRLEPLSGQAAAILDYQRGGLLFNYDLLGYGMMALSTLFTGLSIAPQSRADRYLRALMMLHSVFFLPCLAMPMTGMFVGMDGASGSGGTIALLGWCAYYLPIGVLSCRHFR